MEMLLVTAWQVSECCPNGDMTNDSLELSDVRSPLSETDQSSPNHQAFVVLSIAAAGFIAFLVSKSAAMVIMTVLVAAVIAAMVLYRSAVQNSATTSRFIRDYQRGLEQYRAQLTSLRQEALQATNALSKMRDGVVMLSKSGEILLINPAARRLLALAPEQNYVARPFREVVRIPELNQVFAAASDGAGPQQMIIDLKVSDSVRPIHFQIDQVASAAEESLLMMIRDETESRRVDKIRREFIANISHELKTPLAAIKGYAETVELAINDDPQAAVRFMSQIHAQCLRLERLISDMMQLARAQAGPDNLKFRTVSINDVITESLKSYRPIAESKNVELIVGKDLGAQVHTDSEATLTIVNNLIGNAIHYTPSGGRVTVSCREHGKSWALVVADTGVGIPAEEQQRIFERFYRVEKNRGSASGGTGIGLSMVKNLATTMGGEVKVSSKPGEGSTFEVCLPRAVEQL